MVIFEFPPNLLQKAKTAHFFGHFETQKSQNSLSNHPALFSWLLRTKSQHPGFKNEDFLIYFETKNSQNSLGNHQALFSSLLQCKFQHFGIKNENFVVIFESSRSLTKAKTAHFFGHFETQMAQNSLSIHPALFSWLLRTKFQHPGFKNEDFLFILNS